MALWLVYLLPDPVAVGSIPSVPKKFQRKKLPDFAEVNHQRWFEESVDQTHLVLASGKLVLQQKVLFGHNADVEPSNIYVEVNSLKACFFS